MLNSNQFSNIKSPLVSAPKTPKVKSGGAYKMPKPIPTKEQLDLMESKARLNNAKAAKINREG